MEGEPFVSITACLLKFNYEVDDVWLQRGRKWFEMNALLMLDRSMKAYDCCCYDDAGCIVHCYYGFLLWT